MTETLRIATEALVAIATDNQPGRISNPEQFDFNTATNALRRIDREPSADRERPAEVVAIKALQQIQREAPEKAIADPLMPMKVARQALGRIKAIDSDK